MFQPLLARCYALHSRQPSTFGEWLSRSSQGDALPSLQDVAQTRAAWLLTFGKCLSLSLQGVCRLPTFDNCFYLELGECRAPDWPAEIIL